MASEAATTRKKVRATTTLHLKQRLQCLQCQYEAREILTKPKESKLTSAKLYSRRLTT